MAIKTLAKISTKRNLENLIINPNKLTWKKKWCIINSLISSQCMLCTRRLGPNANLSSDFIHKIRTTCPAIPKFYFMKYRRYSINFSQHQHISALFHTLFLTSSRLELFCYPKEVSNKISAKTMSDKWKFISIRNKTYQTSHI